MIPSFSQSLIHVLSYEGGYVDHPFDPGGATNMGITRQTLSNFRGTQVSKRDVRNLSRQEAYEIYKRMYWDPCRCDFLPLGIDFAVFDCAVNQGVRRAKQFLQRAARARVDGIIGPKTLYRVQHMNRTDLLNEFTARRMRHYGGLVQLFRTFGLGWSRRLATTHSQALEMVNEKE